MDAARLAEEAGALVDAQIRRLRGLSYGALLDLRDKSVSEVIESSAGALLERQTQVFWDGPRRGPLRVFVFVWGPPTGRRWRPASPLSSFDFIRAPDGTFVGEEP